MKRPLDDGWVSILPTLNLRPLKWTARKRSLLPTVDIERLCEVAVKGEEFKNGREFADYIRLMAGCGSRRDEPLRLKWSDVDWERKQLTLGSDGLAKNQKARVVNFNAQLEVPLKEMFPRRAPETNSLTLRHQELISIHGSFARIFETGKYSAASHQGTHCGTSTRTTRAESECRAS